ncbi:MAG TPA: RpiB/LacA/LacB family sugar-phosphate isomerase [Candidatus Doudnabacteria bacterium]|nr:RpiB/LacA/LacB family sugar-phosphate isomerase [Candidatus Doudnabacteria bacterium]
MIYIASDHGGYKLKQQLNKFLHQQDQEFVDLGPLKYKAGDDYPDYGVKVAKQVSKNPVSNLGILLCRSGQGMCIVANKFSGVRAALVWNTKQARLSRNDDMTNVLCLPSDFLTTGQAEAIVKTWLATPFSTDQRHMRRIKKISRLEKIL